MPDINGLPRAKGLENDRKFIEAHGVLATRSTAPPFGLRRVSTLLNSANPGEAFFPGISRALRTDQKVKRVRKSRSIGDCDCPANLLTSKCFGTLDRVELQTSNRRAPVLAATTRGGGVRGGPAAFRFVLS